MQLHRKAYVNLETLKQKSVREKKERKQREEQISEFIGDLQRKWRQHTITVAIIATIVVLWFHFYVGPRDRFLMRTYGGGSQIVATE